MVVVRFVVASCDVTENFVGQIIFLQLRAFELRPLCGESGCTCILGGCNCVLCASLSGRFRLRDRVSMPPGGSCEDDGNVSEETCAIVASAI